jgi:hypothetical protein
MAAMPTLMSRKARSSPARRASIAFALCAIAAVLPSMASAVPATPASAAATPASSEALSNDAKQFFAVVRANFKIFDRNHDGTLTREEIEIDMQDPRITGSAAAALAALKVGATRSNYLMQTRSYTLADIDVMESTLRAGRKLTPNFVKYFVAGLNKLTHVPRELFSRGGPHLTAISQSWTSDCYFLSTVGALAQTNPGSLVRLIKANGDGTYTIAFPGKQLVRLHSPTDSELAAYTGATDGLWLSLLEKAYGVVRIKDEPKQPRTDEPLDSVGFRTGNPSVVGILTGHAFKELNLPQKTHHPADGRLFADFRGELRSAYDGHRAVMLGNSHHVYAITAYDPAADLVTVHNPYNRGGNETLADGSKFQRTEGFFMVPAAELVNNFNYVYFELNRQRS